MNAAEQLPQPPPEDLHPGDPQEAPGLLVQLLGRDVIHRINTEGDYCQAMLLACTAACVARGIPVGALHREISKFYATLEKEARIRSLRESMT